MKKIIYCISGLGADEKVFDNLKVDGHELRYIPWLKPNPKEKIKEYASRMAAYITTESPILLGVSFGGMMGIEIAKQVKLKRLIIVSSIKSTGELPRWMKVVGSLKIHKIMPERPYNFTERIDNRRLGVTTVEERDMVRAYRKKVDPAYLHWAVHQVVNWKNKIHPDHIIHIHGDKDKIFPIKKLKPTHIIKEGTHMIIYNRAKEIAELLEKELSSL